MTILKAGKLSRQEGFQWNGNDNDLTGTLTIYFTVDWIRFKTVQIWSELRLISCKQKGIQTLSSHVNVSSLINWLNQLWNLCHFVLEKKFLYACSKVALTYIC